MSIKLEMQIPPYLLRNREFWTDLELLAGSRRLQFNETYSHAEHKHVILAVCLDEPDKVGCAVIEDKEWKSSWDQHRREELIQEAIRFAAWQLVHNDETEEEEEDDEQG